MIAILVYDRVHAAFFPAADKKCALLSKHHASRVFDTARVERNRESERQLDAVQRERVSAQALRIEKHREDGGDEGTETTRHGMSFASGHHMKLSLTQRRSCGCLFCQAACRFNQMVIR